MTKAGGAKGGSGRDGRLASALRDNLRRRKAASRPGEEAAPEPAAVARENATPADKASGDGSEN